MGNGGKEGGEAEDIPHQERRMERKWKGGKRREAFITRREQKLDLK